MSALQQYLVPKTPAESPWIDKNANKTSESRPASTEATTSGTSSSSSSSTMENLNSRKVKRVPPTRRLVRHVLRARARAVHALATFLNELQHSPQGKRVRASPHLARLYGGFSDSSQEGWREVHEVLDFLRVRGAKIASLESQMAGDYWTTSRAVLSDADDDGETDYSSDVQGSVKENEDLRWIAPVVQ